MRPTLDVLRAQTALNLMLLLHAELLSASIPCAAVLSSRLTHSSLCLCSTRYQPVRAWACNGPPADGQTRCAQHWCSHFWVYALDGQPVGMAASTQQLAALLHLSKVQICGTASKQPVQLPAAFAATDNHQQQQQAKEQQQNPRQGGTSTKQVRQYQERHQQQQQEQPKPELKLTIPKQNSAPVRNPCCTVMVMLEVGGPEDFVLGPAYKVPYCWCCGREAGSKDFCKQHYTARFVVLDRYAICFGVQLCAEAQGSGVTASLGCSSCLMLQRKLLLLTSSAQPCQRASAVQHVDSCTQSCTTCCCQMQAQSSCVLDPACPLW